MLKVLLLSVVIGQIARPLLLTESGLQLAAIGLLLLLVMKGAQAAPRKEKLHPYTRLILTPLSHRLAIPAAWVYLLSWAYAHSTLSRTVAGLLRGINS